ncbi:hypothetical protein HG451_001440 [Candidatus Saccharibacteria bacterium]|nr:hypothetical protein [Candidatus Saccharibacteria bacterium]
MAGRENKKRFVGLNTGLLLILGLVSGVLTVWGVNQIKTAMRAGVEVDNVPAICFDKSERLEKVVLKNARLCENSEEENVSDVTNNQAALFLYSRMTHMTDMGIAATATAIIVLGSMMTIGSFISAIVYFLHNKNNR